MDKVFIILPDNNKAKFITKGFSIAFSSLSYFVFEKKIYDLNIDEVCKIAPNIIFCFWSDTKHNDLLIDFFNKLDFSDISIIHCSELQSDIPVVFFNKNNHHIFTFDNLNADYKVLPCISAKDYKTKFSGYRYNITFAGNPAYECRIKLISHLVRKYGVLDIFSRSFDFYKSVDLIFESKLLSDEYLDMYRESYRGYIESQKELSCIYSSSRINLDIANPNKKEISYRALEILASGGFLLTPYSKVIVSQFEDGKELETYNTVAELTDKIDFYLKNLNLAQLIASKGRKNAVSNHSYVDRLKKILKVIYDKNISN